MNTWRSDGLVLKTRQLLIFMLATLICVGVAVSPARAAVTTELIGEFPTRGPAREVAIADNIAYVAEEGVGLEIIDVSKPEAPKLIWSFGGFDGYGVAVSDTVAYSAVYEDGLVIFPFDIGVLLPGYVTDRPALKVAIADNDNDIIYVVEDGFGLEVHEYTDSGPSTYPLGSFSLPPSSDPYDVASAGSNAYMTVYDFDRKSPKLEIINVRDPEKPTSLNSFELPNKSVPYGVTIADNIAYIANGFAGLGTIDVRNPLNPESLGYLNTLGTARDVAIADNLAYLAAGEAGLEIIDVRDPEDLEMVGGFYTLGYAYGVASADDIAYVAAGDAGLKIIRVTPDATPTIPVNLSVAPQTITETGSPAVIIIATASAPVVGEQTLDVTLKGTATANDFTNPIPATITIADGETQGFFTLNIKEDNLSEGSQIAIFTISNPSSGLSLGDTTSVDIKIADSSPKVTLTLTPNVWVN
ncbi:MAG: hypothetical protein J7647_03950 [Cyanobacteria bacterium SBLK]|nr:hypothetical protein [Cyanobacteria bacterium SBLK]